MISYSAIVGCNNDWVTRERSIADKPAARKSESQGKPGESGKLEDGSTETSEAALRLVLRTQLRSGIRFRQKAKSPHVFRHEKATIKL